MNTTHIEEFIAISQCRSLTQAARRLHVSPSTLSRHVSALEKDIGVTLVDFEGPAVRLTGAGEAFLEKAYAIVQLINDAREDAAGLQDQGCSLILGGYLGSSGVKGLLSKAGKLLQDEHQFARVSFFEPHISPSFSTIRQYDPVEVAKHGVTDVSLFLGSRKLFENDFITCDLGVEPMAVLVSKDNRLADGRQSMSLAELRDLTYTVYPLYPAMNDCFLHACKQAGFTPRTRFKVYDSYQDMFSSHLDGGYMILALADAKRALRTHPSRYTYLRIDDDIAYYERFLAWAEGSESQWVLQFAEIARKLALEEGASS